MLTRVFYFLNRAGLTLAELYQLFECQWVTRGMPVKVVPWIDPTTNIVSCSTDQMTIAVRAQGSAGSMADLFDRANRFIRLWNATGLDMWELDWALAPNLALNPTGYLVLDDSFLSSLAGAPRAPHPARPPDAGGPRSVGSPRDAQRDDAPRGRGRDGTVHLRRGFPQRGHGQHV